MLRAAHHTFGSRLDAAIHVSPHADPGLPRTSHFRGGHPVPNAEGVRAGRAVVRLLQGAGKCDLVVLLLSGGASALLPAPVAGLRLRDKQRVTRLLLARGATIDELNAVRKRLSQLKGGGFARLAFPAQVVALALSDVPGDDPATIGSGPAVADPGSSRAARAVVARFLAPGEIPVGVRRALGAADTQRMPMQARTRVIGSGRTFALAAAQKARALGFHVSLRLGALEGEARERGPELIAAFRRRRSPGPRCVIATGETVVKVRGNGRGGRNQELALASIEALATSPQPTVLAAFATDGVDGRSSSAGAIVDDRAARKARRRGVDIAGALDANDSETALEAVDALIRTGPTGTNVADVALILGIT